MAATRIDRTRKPSKSEAHPLYIVRRSAVHGYGAFATRGIHKGTRSSSISVIAFAREADQRYEDHDENDNHTFLFIVDKQTVIDAGIGGNDARFINHGCDPNCESEIEKGRVFIEAIRTSSPVTSSATTTRSAARRTIRTTSMRYMPAAAARRSAVARCCGRRSGAKKRRKRSADERRGTRAASDETDCQRIAARCETGWPVAVIGATGVVYGDIGTSPLYAFERARDAAAGVADAATRARACSR